mgnify:CR=1 FL=1
MMLQMVPVYAAETVTIDDVDSLFSLNSNLNATATITKDIHLTIDDAFVEKYGTSYIGNSSNYFKGTIEGNDNTIYLNVDTDLSQWGLFYGLDGAKIKNLNIVLENFHSNGSDDNVYFGTLAYTSKNSEIDVDVEYKGNTSGMLMFEEYPDRYLYIGAIVNTVSGTNKITVDSMDFDLKSLPSNSTVYAGAIAKNTYNNIGIDGVNNNYTMLFGNNFDEPATISVYANDNNYIVGGAIGAVYGYNSVRVYGDWQVQYLKDDFKSSDKQNATTNVVLGGGVGKVLAEDTMVDAYMMNGTPEVYIESLGVLDSLKVGGFIGESDSYVYVNHSTNNVFLGNKDKVIGFADATAEQKNTELYIGGIAGVINNSLHAYSNGINLELDTLDAPNSSVYLGNIVGKQSGKYLTLEDNGTSFFSPEIQTNKQNYLGFMVGYGENPANYKIIYNIINATDANAFKTDYDWISGPIGNISKNTTINGFKNNYWGYMDYAVLNQPSQVYFTIPINYYNDTPPEMDDNDYPFLATYDYLNPYQETNKYLTFNNKNTRGIGTLTLTKDCLASIKVILQVIADDAESRWTGHYYRNEDVLNYMKLDEEKPEEEKPSPEQKPDNPKDDEKDTPSVPDKDTKNEKEMLKITTCYDQNGDSFKCKIKTSEICVEWEDDGKCTISKKEYYFEDENNIKHIIDEKGNVIDTIIEKDDLIVGINQAVIAGSINNGKPLPTYNSKKDTEVKFNYFNLPFEIIKRNKSFSDINGQMYKRDIIQAANRMIVEGYTDGTFGPDKSITRAEFATMIVRALGLLPMGDMAFTDVPKDAWYYETVNAAAAWGIVYGIGNGLYAPERLITRQEAAVMLVRASEVVLEANGFKPMYRDKIEDIYVDDIETTHDWARDCVNRNIEMDLVSLRGDSYEPLNSITRAETAHAILNLLRNYEVIETIY